MVSGAMGKISRLRPLSNGPSDDSFQLTLSVSKFSCFSLCRFALFLLSPLWCPLPWCPGQLPQSPTPRSTTAVESVL